MDIAAFLAGHPPFDSLDEQRLERIAASVRTQRFPPGTIILRQSGEPAHFLYVVREGAVEIIEDGRLLDLMGEGELFGAWSLLADASPVATVRSHENTLCYLIAPDLAESVFETSEGLAFMASSLRRRITRIEQGRGSADAADQYRNVGTLVRRPPITCDPGAQVGDAAALMARERVSSLLIPHRGAWGILTDQDLRSRVLAPRVSPTIPVGEVMSFPAKTVPDHTMAGEVLLLMLEGGYHHFPVVDDSGRVVGVVTDTDLMGVGRDTPFALKSEIERARDREAVVAAGRDLPGVVAALVDASVDPVDVGHVVGFTIDALTRQLIELGIERLGEPPVPWAWLALGSAARQEQALRTDQDHAIAYDLRGRPDEEIDPYFAELAEFVTSGLEDAGIPRCTGNVMAAKKALRKSVDGWVDAFRHWMNEIGLEGSVTMSIVFDFRRVVGPLDPEPPLDAVLREAPRNQVFLRGLRRRALDEKPPTGFFGNLVVEAKGEHVGALDIKHRGVTIISNLARSCAIGAGLTDKRTLGRLRAAAAAGVLSENARQGLEEAFRFLWGIRLEHQVAQFRAGLPADDFVDPATLGPVARRGLKEAFRIIARAQRQLGEGARLSTG